MRVERCTLKSANDIGLNVEDHVADGGRAPGARFGQSDLDVVSGRDGHVRVRSLRLDLCEDRVLLEGQLEREAQMQKEGSAQSFKGMLNAQYFNYYTQTVLNRPIIICYIQKAI